MATRIFVLNTYSRVEDYSADIECAVVTLTEADVTRILSMRDNFNAMLANMVCSKLIDNVYGNSFRTPCYAAQFISRPADGEYSRDIVEKLRKFIDSYRDFEWYAKSVQNWAAVDGRRVDYQMMVMSRNHVRWVCCPKHTDIEVTTMRLPLRLLEN